MAETPRVVIDTREQLPWEFKKTIRQTLKTGDYSLEGMESTHCIERKGCMTEWAHNLTEKRFDRVCVRMNVMKATVIILEFDKERMHDWPYNAGLTAGQISEVRTSAKFLRRRLHEIEEKYPNIKIIFAGDQGRSAAIQEFKLWLKT